MFHAAPFSYAALSAAWTHSLHASHALLLVLGQQVAWGQALGYASWPRVSRPWP